MDFTETEAVEVHLWYGKCGYSERNDANMEHLFIVSLNTTKRDSEGKGKKKKKNGSSQLQTCPLPKKRTLFQLIDPLITQLESVRGLSVH